ncbi:endonuclease III domain-containing protein [uncultured Methanobrevibacter sp.]|uniref:endonuclease III domain-containing protein n=1 Tax=uncultured Methanobrevibacter sp. TaxID=253161 RepID=UPI0025D03F61|nr:endonuclease III domain-containing protein [uncultured Methanobrevibacter sp.]
MTLNEIFQKLLNTYSYQGWWPITDYEGSNPTKTGSTQGYHPEDYSFPRNSSERFEIIVGAVLTQNTSWPQVEKSIINLKKLIELTPFEILDLGEDEFKSAIRPSGYFNQKYNYLRNISQFHISLDGRTPERNELLSVKGIGPETCDSILLYAYGEKEFVVDAYTRRIFSHLGIIDEKDSYNKIKKLFEDNFEGSVSDYQEYHALIVEHAKNFYFKKPYGDKDSILNNFKVK